MNVLPPIPRRPRPEGARAKAVVEWADVVHYVFLLVLSSVALVLAVLRWV